MVFSKQEEQNSVQGDISGHGSYSANWGPSFDGVVVHSFNYDLRDYLDRMARYELLFGVATADALHLLNDRQVHEFHHV